MVDICTEDLFILDPDQYEDKDEIDLFASEEVIAKVVGEHTESVTGCEVLPPPDTPELKEAPPISVEPKDATVQPQCNGSVNFLKIATSTEELSSELTDSSPCDPPRPRDIDCSGTRGIMGNSLTIVNQNGSLSSSPTSPSSYTSIDSPPKSPRRRQKILPSSSTVRQLMMAAQSGDAMLLKQLHHKGVNLMVVDEKGETVNSESNQTSHFCRNNNFVGLFGLK